MARGGRHKRFCQTTAWTPPFDLASMIMGNVPSLRRHGRLVDEFRGRAQSTLPQRTDSAPPNYAQCRQPRTGCPELILSSPPRLSRR